MPFDKTSETVLSPLTRLSDVSKLSTIPAEFLVSRWQREFCVDISPYFRGVYTVDLYRCNQTGLQFYWPMSITGDAFFYQSLQGSNGEYYPHDKWEFQCALRDLGPKSKVLEVGCGSGAFLDLLRRHGLTAKGIELNESAARLARERGHDVEALDLKDFLLERADRFNAVCAFQVLEHVTSPLEFIEQILSLLSPGGRLLIGVPNADGCLRHDPEHLLDMPPHHMTRWSTASFYALEKILPIRILRIETESLAQCHVRWYLSCITRRFGTIVGKGLYLSSLITLAPLLSRMEFARRRIVGHTLYVCAERIG